MAKIIGVVGLIGTGKNTVGEYLAQSHSFSHDSFAAPLKDTVSAIFSWDRELLQGDTTESRYWRDLPDPWWENELNWSKLKMAQYFPRFTPRVCLQLFGTDVLRDHFHPDIWILSLKHRIQKFKNNTVITDCRFVNECVAITNLGGHIVRVTRGDEPEWVDVVRKTAARTDKWFEECFPYMASLGIHASEWSSFAWKEDIHIANDGSLDELYKKIDAALQLDIQVVV